MMTAMRTLTRPAAHGVGRRVRRGFTLLEVLLVIAIVVALGAIVGFALVGRRQESQVGLAQIDMNTLKQGLKAFYLKFDRYPTDEEGLRALWDKSAITDEAEAGKWTAFLESPIANDRWGTPWGYRQQSQSGDTSKYDLWSNGPDKQEGTADDIKSGGMAEEATGEGSGGAPATTGGGSSTAPSGN